MTANPRKSQETLSLSLQLLRSAALQQQLFVSGPGRSCSSCLELSRVLTVGGHTAPPLLANKQGIQENTPESANSSKSYRIQPNPGTCHQSPVFAVLAKMQQ